MTFTRNDVLALINEASGKLTEVVIPDGFTSIGNSTFYNCTSLTSVTIPSSVTGIGYYAFGGCTSLSSVTIPNSVTYIGLYAFEGCEALTSRLGNFKAFDFSNDEIKCRNYVFTEGEWSEKVNDIKLCNKGYHFCKNLFEIFNYYFGEIDKDIVIYECEVGEKVISDDHSSKCVTDRIRPVRRLSRLEVLQELNRRQV